MSIRVLAYAKLNLSLRVIGRRPDGYHEILSDVQTIDLADRLTLELGGDGLRVDNDLAVQGRDLAERAAVALLARKRRDSGVRIRVRKSIPAGAGLGGGSSDAAAVLAVLDRMTPPPLPAETLREIAVGIGSDVPLFLRGGRSRIGGRGERVEPSPARLDEHFVVVVPPVHCDTRAIYARWDEMVADGGNAGERRPTWGENDLLRPALEVHPELAPYHEAMRWLGAAYHGMTGSGSSFYAALGCAASAERACAELRKRFGSAAVSVCRPTDVGHRIEGPP